MAKNLWVDRLGKLCQLWKRPINGKDLSVKNYIPKTNFNKGYNKNKHLIAQEQISSNWIMPSVLETLLNLCFKKQRSLEVAYEFRDNTNLMIFKTPFSILIRFKRKRIKFKMKRNILKIIIYFILFFPSAP